MKGKIILLLSFLIITSCSYGINEEKKCVDEKISLSMESFVWICDYKNKLFLLVHRNNEINIADLFEISKIDLDAWKYIFENFNKNKLSEIEKIQIYFILKEVYNYQDSEIEFIIWEIKNQYKQLKVSLHRIILAENLLTTDYELGEDEFDGIVEDYWPLLYDDVLFLEIIFDVEPQRFDSINLVTELEWWYNVLNNQWKELYIKIMKKLLKNSDNEVSIGVLNRFLDSIEK